MAKIMAVIKEPGKKPYAKKISNDIDTMQKIVGGYIEISSINGVDFICNEEGKLRGLPHNFTTPYDYIVGTVAFLGTDLETGEFCDAPVDKVMKMFAQGKPYAIFFYFNALTLQCAKVIFYFLFQ